MGFFIMYLRIYDFFLDNNMYFLFFYCKSNIHHATSDICIVKLREKKSCFFMNSTCGTLKVTKKNYLTTFL